jgi:4a-hydroxytetrahydrobiopterin dehydratase
LQEGLAWQREGHVLVKVHTAADFPRALAYVNAVGALAEQEDHHPVVELSGSQVTLRLWTHSAGGLTDRDLDLAGRIDALRVAPA